MEAPFSLLYKTELNKTMARMAIPDHQPAEILVASNDRSIGGKGRFQH